MSYIVFIFAIIGTVLCLKNGKGKEKLLALLPFGVLFLLDIIHVILSLLLNAGMNTQSNVSALIGTLFSVIKAATIITISVGSYNFIKNRKSLRAVNEI